MTSGRPQSGEFAFYAADDIAFVEGDDAVAALETQGRVVEELLASLDEGGIAGRTYAPGKWTVKEVIGHLIDDERIFAYRILCIARGDTRPLAGFDENDYVAATTFEARPLAELINEYRSVRNAMLALLRPLSDEEWGRRGTANDHSVTVRGLAFHVAGHELHHLRTLKDRYFEQSAVGG